jgi:glutathione S-transferase
MIELIQIPWSPFCIVQRRILEYARAPFRITNIPYGDRSLIWRLTRERYYGVPIIKDGKTVVFEIDEQSQVIAKYLDQKLQLGLFPHAWEGVQNIVYRYIESEIEDLTFKLNDIHYRKYIPAKDHLSFLRHKERKFGRGCVDQWAQNQEAMIETLGRKLIPFEEMLADKPFLLDATPRFVDFDLFGMLGNFLYSGNFKLPALHTRLKNWYDKMSTIHFATAAREKLHT